MIEEVINSIIQAEDEADKIVKDAGLQAKQSVADANVQAEKVIELAKQQAKESQKQCIAKAQKKADDDYDKAVLENNKKIENIALTAKKNTDKAIEVIIGRIKEKYARC